MKPFDQLTRLGKLRRLRKLAEKALPAYGLAGADLTFLHYQGNVIFRAESDNVLQLQQDADTFVPGRYALRILSISDLDTIRSELTFLAALRQEAGLPVPEPVPTVDAELLLPIITPGVPRGRVVTLMRWVDGRRIKRGLGTQQVKSWGQLMGRLHRFAAAWQPPQGFKRFRWDWQGLLGPGLGHPIDELVAAMPEHYRQPFLDVSSRVRCAMQSFGQARDAYGLIHADMYLENLVFKQGRARAIDFEDCGFGYWMFDIAVAMSEFWWSDERPRYQDLFLGAYSREFALSARQLAQLDLFIAAQYAVPLLWSTAFIKTDPARREEHQAWQDREGRNLLRCYEQL